MCTSVSCIPMCTRVSCVPVCHVYRSFICVMSTRVSYVLLKHLLFGKIYPHSLVLLRSSNTENSNSLGHLPLGCNSFDGPGRDHPGAWPEGCLAVYTGSWKGRNESYTQHSHNKPTTNLFPVLYDTGYFK